MRRKTRKQRVYEYLAARPNRWVPGMELMNAEIGGTRAGARVFDLNQDGYEGRRVVIESRPSKSPSSVWEYRLLVDEPVARPPIFVQEGMFG